MVEVIHGIRGVGFVKLDMPIRYSRCHVKAVGRKASLSWVIKGRRGNSMHGGTG